MAEFDIGKFLERLGQGFGFTENPYNKVAAENADEAKAAFEEYRPQAYEARLNALQNASGLFAPLNATLVDLYGSGAALPYEDAFKNPWPGGAMGGEISTGADEDVTQRGGGRTDNNINDPVGGGVSAANPWDEVKGLEDGVILPRGPAGGVKALSGGYGHGSQRYSATQTDPETGKPRPPSGGTPHSENRGSRASYKMVNGKWMKLVDGQWVEA